jgi:hypothetical protein
MLMFDKPMILDGVPGVQVYADSGEFDLFYLLASGPRIRIDETNGKPVFTFLKYREPIERAGGTKGGGFIIFDSEFVVPSDMVTKAKELLTEQLHARFPNINPPPQARIGNLNFTRGTASVQFLNASGGLVQKIENPAAPSLYGNMICPITIELSPEGATLAEQALQGQGGVLQVKYDIFLPVRLPPVTAHAYFHAEKIMSFYQREDIDLGWHFFWWGRDSERTEKVIEFFHQSESGGVVIDPGMVTDDKVISTVRDWAYRQLDDAFKRMIVGDINPVSEEARKVPDGVQHLTRDFLTTRISDFSRSYSEGYNMDWDPGPSGSLQNITSITGKDGKPFKWTDFARIVDTDDPFFKTINLNIMANADFTNLPLFSIDVHCEYPAPDKRNPDGSPKKAGGAHIAQDFRLQKSDDVGKFASFTDDNDLRYSYSYKVNFKNDSQPFEMKGRVSDSTVLTVDVDSAGCLAIDLEVGNVNFEQMFSAVIVDIRYEDKANGVPRVEQQFTFDKDHRSAHFGAVIHAPRTEACFYDVTYQFRDGSKQYTVKDQKSFARQIYFNSPFTDQKTVHVRPIGDLTHDISNIFVDLQYEDKDNAYVVSQSIALNKANPFADCAFPVLDRTKGKVTYSGTIQFADGTAQDISPSGELTKDTLMVGRQPDDSEFLTITVLPDMLDFAKLKLAKVSLHYSDGAMTDLVKDVILKANAAPPPPWSIRLADKTKRQYDWHAQYFMADGSVRQQGVPKPVTTTELTLIPEIPSA